MQFSLTFLGIAALSNLARAQSPVIALGQELQNSDQTNHWVTWIDKADNPCRTEDVLGVLTKNPCGSTFNLGEVQYSFAGCNGGDNYPNVLLDSSGLQIGQCVSAHDYISCSDSNHDIIKHILCEIDSGE